MTHKKINIINSQHPFTLFIFDKDKTIINIDNIEYIEKKDIYKITTLNTIELNNILNRVSKLRRCLINDTLRTIKIKKNKRNYILYCLEDIKKLNDFKIEKQLKL